MMVQWQVYESAVVCPHTITRRCRPCSYRGQEQQETEHRQNGKSVHCDFDWKTEEHWNTCIGLGAADKSSGEVRKLSVFPEI
jgi:hypothetical protein